MNALGLCDQLSAVGFQPQRSSLRVSTLSITTAGRGKLARATFERALAVRTALGEGDTIEAAAILNNIGGLEGQVERYPEAIAAHTRALEIQRRMRGADSVQVTNSLRGLAIIHSRQKNHEEALRLDLEVLAIYEKTFPAGHPIIGGGHEGVAAAFLELKRLPEARQHAERLSRAAAEHSVPIIRSWRSRSRRWPTC